MDDGRIGWRSRDQRLRLRLLAPPAEISGGAPPARRRIFPRRRRPASELRKERRYTWHSQPREQRSRTRQMARRVLSARQDQGRVRRSVERGQHSDLDLEASTPTGRSERRSTSSRVGAGAERFIGRPCRQQDCRLHQSWGLGRGRRAGVKPLRGSARPCGPVLTPADRRPRGFRVRLAAAPRLIVKGVRAWARSTQL
jgi:hypothetical protein